MAGLIVRGITKRYGVVTAVDSVTFEVRDGEFLALLGPSGCGKTTLLRLVAGFEVPDDGSIEIGGTVYAEAGSAVPPELRELGMVFQSYALWPHLSVFGNVAYGLRVRGFRRAELRERVAAALDLVGLSGFENRRPSQLSGGQRQRIALARCLAVRPRLVLLDEPLANLDAHLRESMQTELRRIQRESGATFLFVTHDQAEAMSLADRIAVMDRGRIAQIAVPEDLYGKPETGMVASFIGRGTVLSAAFLGPTSSGRGRADLWGRSIIVRTPGYISAGPCSLCVRSRDLELVPLGTKNAFSGKVRSVSYRGHGYILEIAPEGETRTEIRIEIESRPPAAGVKVGFRFRDAWVIPEIPEGNGRGE